jgi:hypothetical protein
VLTRLSEFLRRHEPLTKLLMRLALLVILATVAWDSHYVSLDLADIADRIDQMQDDISSLRDDIEGGDDSPGAPAKLQGTSIKSG